MKRWSNWAREFNWLRAAVVALVLLALVLVVASILFPVLAGPALTLVLAAIALAVLDLRSL